MACSNTLKNKVTIITGGSRGIGEGCVRLFASCEGNVVFCAPKVDENEGKKLEQEINSLSGNKRCMFVTCDVTQEAEVINLIDLAVKQYGHIDYLINCAGWHPPTRTIDQFTTIEFVNLFNLNVLGTFMTCKYALPYIRQSKGSIVNIGSVVSVIGQKEAVTYVATKGAVEAMSKALAIDEAQHGVRVNCVSPGCIDTPLLRSFMASYEDPKDTVASLNQQILIPRLGSTEEIAKSCLFLVRDATYVTGHNLMVTGGLECGYGYKV